VFIDDGDRVEEKLLCGDVCGIEEGLFLRLSKYFLFFTLFSVAVHGGTGVE
jgi:hypothetical protein